LIALIKLMKHYEEILHLLWRPIYRPQCIECRALGYLQRLPPKSKKGG
jgi:hypothetical protein